MKDEPSNKEILAELDAMTWRINGFKSLIAKRVEEERKK